MFCRKALFLAGLTLCVSISSFGQIVTSAKDGLWSDPSTWEGGIIPSMFSATSVIVRHEVILDSRVEVSSVTVQSSLMLSSSGFLELQPPEGGTGHLTIDGGILIVDGTLKGNDDIAFASTATSCFFRAGSTFHFNGGPKAVIPIATWDRGSTLLITGFRSQGYINLTFAPGWRQSFGNVVYDCPNQTVFVDLNGHLRAIQGSLIVRNTNSQSLRLSTTQRPSISIGEDFIIEGPSEVWLSTNSDSASVVVGGNFDYRSTSSGPSYLATRGRTFLSIGGDFFMDSPGALRFCSGGTDSTGVRKSSLIVNGDLAINRGSILAPAPGSGHVVFNGSAQQYISVIGAPFSGNFSYYVSEQSSISLGESALTGSGSIYVKGRLALGSAHTNGALQQSGGHGNIQVTGTRNFYPTATIEYNGLARQTIGAGFPDNSAVNLYLNNADTVVIDRSITARTIAVKGKIKTQGHPFIAFGDVLIDHSTAFRGKVDLHFRGASDQVLDANDHILNSITANKSAGRVSLTSPVSLQDALHIESQNTIVDTNDNLRLLSDSDSHAATVGVLPEGSVITGRVCVERFMSGKGRIYRYISSPVEDATVADLQDDFPVTGVFEDPSTGRGINASSPSLYVYDAPGSVWAPYPQDGPASSNPLSKGLGYSAFIREANTPTIVDFCGTLTQGVVNFPIAYNENAPTTSGWNLLGNPYPSTISWAFEEGWSRSDVSSAIAIRDNVEGRFRYFDGEVGDINVGRIAIGQAFWVRATGPGPSLVITEKAKDDGGAFYRRRYSDPDYAEVQISGGGMSDKAWIRLRADAKKEVDEYDAVKMSNDCLGIAIRELNSSLAIDARDHIACNEEIPLEVKVSDCLPGTSRYLISISTKGVLQGARIRIRDALLEKISSSAEYEFVADGKALSVPGRFSLVITRDSVAAPVISSKQPECGDSSYQIHLRGTHISSNYFVNYRSNTFVAKQVGEDHALIDLPVTDVKDSMMLVNIMRRTHCSADTISSLTIPTLRRTGTPVVTQGVICPNGNTHLDFFNADGSLLTVFDTSDKETPLASTTSTSVDFESPPGVRELFVIAKRYGFCASFPMYVSPVQFSGQPLIIQEDDEGLKANYPQVHWYFEREPISYSDHILFIGPGEYQAMVTVNGCEFSATWYPGFSQWSEVEVWPVPVTSLLTVRHKDANVNIERIRLISYDGRVIEDFDLHQNTQVFDLSQISKGMYILEVTADKKTERLKILRN